MTNVNKKTMDLQKLVQHPASLKLLILHTPFPLQISTLYRCTNLIKLDLSKNNLQSFPYIGNLANLKFMFLHQNKLNHSILTNIFFNDNQNLYSPLSKSIVWVTFWGNKNNFFARHFLINQTSVLAVDNYMVVPQQRKQSVIQQGRILPFSQQADIAYIIQNKQALSKNATQQQYMDQFWQEMRQLRKKIQVICPIIRIQKFYRSWIVRKRIKDKKQQCIDSIQLKTAAFQGWKKLFQRNKKLLIYLQKRNKQHYLLPLKLMKVQNIKFKMLQWAARAKQKVLYRKLSLKKQMQFYQILRSNMLMFRSLYNELQIEKSDFLMIDFQSYTEISKTLMNFIRLFNGEEKFTVQKNTRFIVRQVSESIIKKEFPRFLNINKRSYVIRLDYDKKQMTSNPVKTLLSQNICSISSHSTNIKSLFRNQNKVHFSTQQKKVMEKHMIQLQKRQNMILQEFLLLKGSKRVLKDIVRCVYYFNTNILKINNTCQLSNNKKIHLFSQISINKLSSVTLVQKFWRAYIFRKKQKQNAQLCAKQYRAVAKIQRWIRNIPLRKKSLFQKQVLPLLRLINDPYFIVKTDDYLKLILSVENPTNNYLHRMKILEQNIVPYFNLQNKKMTLFWNPEQKGPTSFQQKIKICYENRKIPFNSEFIKSVFKCENAKQIIDWPVNNQKKQVQNDNNSQQLQLQKGQFSHLFHYNTITSLGQKDNSYWMKILCGSVKQAKIRVLGILLKSYSFKYGFGIKIYGHQIIDFNKYFKKNILSNQSIFITKGDVELKQENQKIHKFNFKSKIYLKDQSNIKKPTKLQENLLIFAHNFNFQSNKNYHQRSISQPQLQFPQQDKKHKKRTKLSIDKMQFQQVNDLQKNQTLDIQPKNITLSQQHSHSQPKISKQDLLPTALKKMLPLKKQIKSYKFQKRIKKREPSFVLDNVSRQQRFMTQPDLATQDYSHIQQSDKCLLQYSTVKEKIRKNYVFKKDLMKNKKQDLSFHQNFINLNNFLQQQSISEQRRRIKTELQISAYQSADKIRVSLEKSSDEIQKRKLIKMKKVQQDIKLHKQTLEKHRLLRDQQKEQIQKAKSVSRQKRKHNNQQVRRLKVSFAQQCFPIINRSYNSLRSQSESINKNASQQSISKKYQISTAK